MNFSRHSIEVLLDLIEVKLSCMEVMDHEDKREYKKLELAKRDLLTLKGSGRRLIPPVAPAVMALTA